MNARNATVMNIQKYATSTHEFLRYNQSFCSACQFRHVLFSGVERLLELFVGGVTTTQKARTVRCVSEASIKTQPNSSQTRTSVLHVIANLMVHGMVENVTVEQLKEKKEKKG